jgi:DNA helicase-2/ATP-dependent DNA helicase PcrA
MENVLDSPPEVWSSYQEAIFENVRSGKGHTVVKALAGTGKTTTVVRALRYVPRGVSVLMVAFNKVIADELKNRVPRGVEVSTCHSFGLKTITRALGRLPIDKDKTYNAFRDLYRGGVFSAQQCRVVCKLVSLAKATLAETPEDLDDIIDEFGLIDDPHEVKRQDVIRDAQELLLRAKTDPKCVDFDDMIWLPHALALAPRTYDRVFVDETQDLNRAQIELVMKACSRFDGRITAIGDENQALYGFRGADRDSIRNIIDRYEATVLPLSITYRCPKSVVRVAQSVVPEFEAGPDNPEGSVDNASTEQMVREAGPGDFVLSRTNAPLIGLCLRLLREGRKALVRGRDIGTNLAAIVKRSEAKTTQELAVYLDEWSRNEQARLLAKQPPQEAAAQLVADKAECLEALSEGTGSVAEVLLRIERLFDDATPKNAVVFCTTHKAKGLEAPTVWVLRDTYRPRQNQAESACWYVAVTRAKSRLVLVEKESA